MRRNLSCVVSATISFVLLIPFACTSEPYSIQDEAFSVSDACDGEGTYEIRMEDGRVSASAVDEIQAKFKEEAGFGAAVWCHGLRHVFVGRVEHAGYVFESDADDPLQFVLDRAKGVYYESGVGTVTDPEGEVHTFR